jgi:hypothetical protein
LWFSWKIIHFSFVGFTNAKHCSYWCKLFQYCGLSAGLASQWVETKLHAITSDGAPVMMGVHSGINTQVKDLCQEVNSKDSILIIWCSLHQLNLKVDYYLTRLDTSIDFRPVLNGLIGYL